MKPFVLPASTSIAIVAGAIAAILAWILKQWFGVDVPEQIKDAFIILITALGGHFTIDSPTPAAARGAVSDAAAIEKLP